MTSAKEPLSLEWLGQPPRGAGTAVLAALEPAVRQYTIDQGERRRSTSTYLDTIDGRLRKRGLTLVVESDPDHGVLVVSGRDGVDTTALTEAPTWPALRDQLPPGSARDRVAPAMWVRAVAPVIETTSITDEVVARNADDKIVARIRWHETTESGPSTGAPLIRVTITPLRGYDKDADRIARLLMASGSFGVPERTLTDELLARAGPADNGQRTTIAPGMAADVTVATALLGFLDAVERNVDGTIDDVDTEFLHDLRVVVRRTRSALKLTGDLLPQRIVTRAVRDFTWLGDVTTPTRDLDVYLLEVDDLAKRLSVGAPEDLDDFAAELWRERAVARRSLVRALRSKRFARLCADWRHALTDVVAAGGDDQSGTVEDLARDRVRVAYRRVLKRANAITPDSPSERVHSLRKRAKELRYVLEMFAGACDRKQHRAVVKNLKQLQNILGDFQDGEVQSAALRVFADRMLAAGSAGAPTLLAMGELSAQFAVQQREARNALTEALPGFLGSTAHKRVAAMLP